MAVIVIGLDGATQSVLQPLFDDGQLPNLQRLFEDGLSGGLQSCLPPVTYPAWKCLSTGRSPQQLGSYYFLDLVDEGDQIDISPNTSLDFDGEEIWDYLSEDGKKSAVVNVPSTCPPHEINGTMVAGPMLLGDQYVYPPEFEDELAELGYQHSNLRVEHALSNGRSRDEIRNEILRKVSSKFEATSSFLEDGRYDFVQLTVFLCDAMKHLYWDEWEAEGPDATGIPDVYRRIDEGIGTLLEHVDDDDYVFVVSDHGFQPLEHEFRLNSWLESQGYLTRTDARSPTRILYRLGLNSDSLRRTLSSLGLLSVTRKLVPERIRGSVPDEGGDVSLNFATETVDWSNTKAVMAGDGVIYTNDRAMDDVDEFVTQLMDELRVIETPQGRPALSLVGRTEDLYGDRGEDDPAILALGADEILLKSTLAESPWSDGSTSWWRAIHHREGVFALTGPDVPEGTVSPEIYDIAPTVLHLLDAATEERVDSMVGSIIDRLQ